MAKKRDYKDEYKKFQSSPERKKYRAELNKYNREKGTYGNGDGKDASHKGGKIVGFEASSKNKGRAEKSRKKGSKRKVNEVDKPTLRELLKLTLSDAGFDKLPLNVKGMNREDIIKLKKDFKKVMNKFYKDHKMNATLGERKTKR